MGKGSHTGVDATSTGTRLIDNPSSDLKFYLKAFILGTAAISTWRGLWLLSDLYIFPNDLTISGIVSVSIGLIIFFFYREIRL